MSISSNQYRKDAPSEFCVLIAEDDPHIRLILRQLFHSRGIQVFDASDGVTAVSTYRKHRDEIRMVLLDVNLPVLDGPQVLAEIQLINPNVNCCFITGGGLAYSKKELMELGAICVFDKPFANINGLVDAAIEFCDEEHRNSLHVHGGMKHRRADSEPPAAIHLEHHGEFSDDDPDSNHHGDRR